jgi:hypothetical protein
MPRRERLRWYLVRRLPKNFQTTYQLDIHLCIEFLCTLSWQNCPSRIMSR